MTERWARFSRGWLVAGFATFAAAFSHGAAGGAPPPAFAIVLALAFSGPVCVGLAGRSLSAARVAPAVAVSQLAYHGLFAFFGPSAAPVTALTAHVEGHALHDHGATAIHTDPVSSGVAASGFVMADPGMLWAHAGAAVATFAAIVFAERTVKNIAAAAAPLLTSIVDTALRALRAVRASEAPPLRAALRALPARHERMPVAPRALLIGFLRHRGPPAYACA